MISSRDLLHQVVNGDQEALAQLLEEHGPVARRRLEGRIPRRWRSALSMDDIMQQTYLDAFVDIDRFVPHGKGSFPAWLTALAKCNLLDALKMLEAAKRGNGRRRIGLRSPQDSFNMLYELVQDSGTSPSRHAARDEACTVLKRALEKLPESYRRVVQKYDLEGCSAEDVGREIQRSPGAVYMIRARAHRRMREIMGRASQYLSTE